MKKFSIFAVLAMVLCFCTSSYGANAAGQQGYVGIGASFAFDNFDTGDVEDFLPPIDADFDTAFGGNLNIGYHLNDNISIAFVLSYLPGFDSDEDASFEEIMEAAGIEEADLLVFGVDEADLALLDMVDVSIGIPLELDIWTFMLEGKYAMPGNVSPYLVLGIGAMYASLDGNIEVTAAYEGESASVSIGGDDSDTKACWKVGLGVDWWATPNVTVGLEGSYVGTFGDHEFDLLGEYGVPAAELGLDYFTVGLNAAYHF